jgi:hypothetical protein
VRGTDLGGNPSAVISRDFVVDAFVPGKCGKQTNRHAAKAKRAKCLKANAKAKAKWKSKHHLS